MGGGAIHTLGAGMVSGPHVSTNPNRNFFLFVEQSYSDVITLQMEGTKKGANKFVCSLSESLSAALRP